MEDQPSTFGFICHICIWRERAESHELMDIGTLMHHGQRYHYMQDSQMEDYLSAAYSVYRGPNVLDESMSYSCDQQMPPGLDGAGFFDTPRQAMEGVSTEDAKHEEDAIMIKKEDCKKEIPVELPFESVVNHSFSSVESQGDSSQNYRCEECFDNPLIPPHSFNDPMSGVQNAFFETLYDPYSGFVDVNELRAFSMSLPNPHLGLDDLYKEWVKEEYATADLDYDLASSQVFAVQLEEYQQRMHGLSQSSGSEPAKPNVLEEMKDRLHVWPDKVAVDAGAPAESLTAVEENAGIEWPMAFSAA